MFTDETKKSVTSQLSLANESQFLLLNRASVSALHDRIEQRQSAGETQDSFGMLCEDWLDFETYFKIRLRILSLDLWIRLYFETQT